MASVIEGRSLEGFQLNGADHTWNTPTFSPAPSAPEGPIATPVRSRPRSAVQSCPAEIASRLAVGRSLAQPQGNRSPAYCFAKRAIDVLGAAALLLALSPLLLLVFLVLLFTTRGRPLFAQRRVGYCGRLFTMYKFRTMRPNAERLQHMVENQQQGPVFKNRHDPRVTRLGRFLRQSSLDETPQLLNVLLGHMSLVGPRPPVPAEVIRYETWQLRRLAVKPGLTCLWQVSGRCEIGFEDWVRMDLWYLRNQNLSTDLRLLANTPWCVLTRKGAY